MSKKTLIGRWALTGEILGEGGQAKIFVVSDSSGTQKGEFALKLLSNELRKGRIDLEILTTKSLFVTGAPVLEIIDDYTISDPDNKHPWYVTKIVKGGNLRKRLISGKCYSDSEKSALALFQNIVSAVKKVHASNVAHRDLKPENVLLENDYEVVLCDLGLCLPLSNGLAEKRLTQELERIGSIHYIPKEAFACPQPSGRGQFSYDVFAIGKILYELYAGKILPGFEKPYGEGFDLSKQRGGEFYAGMNLLLEGLLNDNPSIRLDTWDKIDSNIGALKGILEPKDAGNEKIEELRRRLIVVNDDLRRAQYVDGEKRAYDAEEIKKRCKELCEKVLSTWENNQYIKLIKVDFLNENPQIADFQVNKNENFFGRLGGPFVHSRYGKEPIEKQGRTSNLEAIAEGILGVNAKPRGNADSLWLGCSVFNQKENIKVLLMELKQENREPRSIDIVQESIIGFKGSIYDVALEKQVLEEAERKAEIWCREVISMIEKATKK